MTTTLQTTYTHLVGSSFEESYDPDLLGAGPEQ